VAGYGFFQQSDLPGFDIGQGLGAKQRQMQKTHYKTYE
jgi:hypothetical protein